jgi:hypothetical protein
LRAGRRRTTNYSDFVEISAEEIERVRTEVHAFVDACPGTPVQVEVIQPGTCGLGAFYSGISCTISHDGCRPVLHGRTV